MLSIKIIFDDGDSLYTNINGNKETVTNYYLNKTFNVGCGEYDKLKKCITIEFLND